jgi:tetratricopeptide (TPR) repeat protein
MAKSPSIALYNQDRFGDEDFVANFVARIQQVEGLLGSLRHIARGGPTEHQILIGTRGMGKTSLLRRIAIGVTADPELSAAFIPLRFREEQYNVLSLNDFWRNCGEALAEWSEQSGNQVLADKLDAELETPDWRDDEKAEAAFFAACTEAGGRAILLLDNLDLILEAIKEDGCWTLRNALQKKDGPIVIGAATALLAQGAQRDAPFYEFFHPHMLEPLTEAEVLACLNALARQRGKAGARVKAILAREPERVRTLYVLTGGNPRILALVYGLFEQADSEEIFADLEALLDQVTPFYKARIEEYGTPLQRAVIDGIALNWDPITSNALSKQTGVEPTTLSGQLIKLKKDGLIEEVERSGSRAGFQLAERFLNIWYLMRHGTRKTKQRLRWFTIFLTKLFSAEELERMAGEARSGNGKWRAEQCEAIIEAFEKKVRLEANDDLAFISSAFNAANVLYNSKKFADAIEHYDKILEFQPIEGAASVDFIAMSLFNKGLALKQVRRFSEAIATYDDISRVVDLRNSAANREVLGLAMLDKAAILLNDGQYLDAIDVYDGLISKFDCEESESLIRLLVRALFNRAIAFESVDRFDEANADYSHLVDRFEKTTDPEILIYVVKSLSNFGYRLGDQGQAVEAIEKFQYLILSFKSNINVEIQEYVGYALLKVADYLKILGHIDDAVDTYDVVISKYADSPSRFLQMRVVFAFEGRLSILTNLEKFEIEIERFHEFVENLKADHFDDKERYLATIEFFRGWLFLSYLGDPVRAEQAFRNALVADPKDVPTKANLIWAIIYQDRVKEASILFNELGDFTGSGRHLWEAGLELASGDLNVSLSHLLVVLNNGLEDDGFEYFEALLWYLRLAEKLGHGERLIGWFGETGHSDRYAPVFGALVALVRGERMLLDLNPEVRGVARPIYARLAAGRRAGVVLAP